MCQSISGSFNNQDILKNVYRVPLRGQGMSLAISLIQTISSVISLTSKKTHARYLLIIDLLGTCIKKYSCGYI
ncbi:Hypothetical predicted protein [Cloeon dipterum]|uniref:Uncharacterized protein n=1 Tax=Cloeon dipterum TaxID=197152 RepID=A0A8S1C5X4_9INSE|nr:Hypothetical predicted protein [Cloeon dipterum]